MNHVIRSSIWSLTAIYLCAVLSGCGSGGTVTPATPATGSPVFSPVAGSYTVPQLVAISTPTSGTSIRYTIDGSVPTETNGTLYTGPVLISPSTTLSAIAYESGLHDSAVTTGAYTLQGPSATDVAFLTSLEQAEVQYFIDQAETQNYLMPATWSVAKGPDARAGAAATGLELAALCIADSHGWITHANALNRVTTILQLVAAWQIAHPETMGLMYQYMNSDGSRYGTSSVGTDDGSKLILGAIVARQYFNTTAITNLVNQIYDAIDWQDWVNHNSTSNSYNQVYESWTPESQFGSDLWGRFSEGPVQIILLGMGAPTPGYAFTLANWNAWTRGPSNTYGTYTWIGFSPALFVQQYPEAFFDLHGMTDNSSSGAGISYWNNSIQATLAEWQWSQDIAGTAPVCYPTSATCEGPFSDWGVDLWGLTASTSQSGSFNTWGGPVPSTPVPDGTLTPGAAGGSLPFTPVQSLQTLEYMKAQYPTQAWVKNGSVDYGFVEAFNPENGWTAAQVSTNPTGQTLLMTENYLTGLIWNNFMSAPEIINALSAAQVTK